VSLRPIKAERLIKILARAGFRPVRWRVLYTALDGEERGYLYLAMRTVDRVRSVAVGRILVTILRKLRDALKSPFVRMVETFGLERAKRIAAQAVEWGYVKARGWASNLSFAKYLTIIDVNKPSGWGV